MIRKTNGKHDAVSVLNLENLQHLKTGYSQSANDTEPPLNVRPLFAPGVCSEESARRFAAAIPIVSVMLKN